MEGCSLPSIHPQANWAARIPGHHHCSHLVIRIAALQLTQAWHGDAPVALHLQGFHTAQQMRSSQGTLKGLQAVPRDTDMVLRSSTPSKAGGTRNPVTKRWEMWICSCSVLHGGTRRGCRSQIDPPLKVNATGENKLHVCIAISNTQHITIPVLQHRSQQGILMIAFLPIALASMGRHCTAEVGEDPQHPPAQMEQGSPSHISQKGSFFLTSKPQSMLCCAPLYTY